MKCWVCDGLGVTYKSRCSAFPKETCTRCNGTGEIQTNEEWFGSLSTEEKATFLAIQVRLGVEFHRTNDERYQDHDWWVKWLKAVHNHED